MAWEANPLEILTFIAAPAILTNASSVMALGTSNRFARAIDRARSLSTSLDAEALQPDAEGRRRQLRYTERRVLLLVRALTAFYVSVGSFAAASLLSLVAAVFILAGQDALRQVALSAALAAGFGGVAGLVGGSALLVWESSLTYRILRAETRRLLGRVVDRPPAV